jgi:glycerol-3-phosphate acyltransferase PlsY
MNMLRYFGVKIAILTLILDILKGLLPALLGALLFRDGGELSNTLALYACGLAAIVGHNFPVLYKFKGGKGVATTVGVFFIVNWWLTLIMIAVTAIYMMLFEYNAVGSFIFITAMTLYQAINSADRLDLGICILLAVIYFLACVAHRENIARLLAGRENKASILKSIKQKRLIQQEQKWLETLKSDRELELKALREKRMDELKSLREQQNAELKTARREIKQELKEAKTKQQKEEKEANEIADY